MLSYQQTIEQIRASSGAAKLLDFQARPVTCMVDAQDFCANKSYFPEQNIFPLVFAHGNPCGFQWELGYAAVLGGVLPHPPAFQKSFGDKPIISAITF